MNIPAIGAARGVFELFVPGAFVILNVLVVFYAAVDGKAQDQIRELASNPLLSLVVLICFGYLVGVILRLFRAEIPDRWSARLNRLTNKSARKDSDARAAFRARWDPKTEEDKERFFPWAVEDFPYIESTGHTHTFGLEAGESTGVSEFHRKVWAVPRERRQHKTFFNFCKTVINSVDERAAGEIYSAEALVRYLAGMFYSLLLVLMLMLAGLVLRLVLRPNDLGWVYFLILLVVYLAMLLAILRHYRIMRLKEVEIVFSATYHHRELFEPSKTGAALPWHKRLRRALAILAGRSK